MRWKKQKYRDKNKMPTLSKDDCIEDDNAYIYLHYAMLNIYIEIEIVPH